MQNKVIQLGPDDNVAIAIDNLSSGETVSLGGRELITCEKISSGHKFATQKIDAGEKVLRCNVPIGSATECIQVGAWVHTHNLKSDYMPTFTFDAPMPSSNRGTL
ncbi:MAG: UxaA family hydrolase [Verrucomicrobia bacterium]|nr:UxaA family hydrolase [Verrucomicrobiota bacterium]